MTHRPGVSFLCGPYALVNVAKTLDPAVGKKAWKFLEKTESPPTGFSIPEVHRMAARLGVKQIAGGRRANHRPLRRALEGGALRSDRARSRRQFPRGGPDLLQRHVVDETGAGSAKPADTFSYPTERLPGWSVATAADGRLVREGGDEPLRRRRRQ